MTVTDAKDLPACPFCASTNLKVYFYEYPEPDAFVQCGDCTTTGPTATSAESAIEKWSKRK